MLTHYIIMFNSSGHLGVSLKLQCGLLIEHEGYRNEKNANKGVNIVSCEAIYVLEAIESPDGP